MCDTLGVIGKKSYFAKNSDRGPNESQVIEYIKGYKTKDKKKKLTYIEVDEVEEVKSILISRPTWMWGAEMGVNECGVCIGNEALFTTRNSKHKSLTGMDLLRLALERSSSAREAVDIIINLLDKYNQGGNCGYDHNFFYDNSFLIMDYKELYILETSGKNYNLKKEDKANISNKLSSYKNIDSKGKIKENKIITYFSKSSKREEIVKGRLDEINGVLDIFSILRTHSTWDKKIYRLGSTSSPCMHAGNYIGDHTTSSLVVELSEDDMKIYFTGTSTPCMSLFKPYKFGDKVLIDEGYWLKREKLFRSLLGREIDYEFFTERNKMEEKIVREKLNFNKALKIEKELDEYLLEFKKIKVSPIYKLYWNGKNRKLGK